jgi:hypothetical protein
MERCNCVKCIQIILGGLNLHRLFIHFDLAFRLYIVEALVWLRVGSYIRQNKNLIFLPPRPESDLQKSCSIFFAPRPLIVRKPAHYS